MSELSDDDWLARKRLKAAARSAWKEFKNSPDYARKCPNGLPFAGKNSHHSRAHVPDMPFNKGHDAEEKARAPKHDWR